VCSGDALPERRNFIRSCSTKADFARRHALAIAVSRETTGALNQLPREKF
jgi:hypothetical protein